MSPSHHSKPHDVSVASRNSKKALDYSLQYTNVISGVERDNAIQLALTYINGKKNDYLSPTEH